jgi:hypothetical protein
LIDLADVGHEIGLESVGLRDQAAEALEQLVVGDVAKCLREFHDCNIGTAPCAALSDSRRARGGVTISNEFYSDGAYQKEDSVA